MLKRRLIVIAVISFFFVLPLAGYIFMFRNLHGTIRKSGEVFVYDSTEEFLRKQDWEALETYGTITLKKNLKQAQFEDWLYRMGGFRQLTDVKVVRSWVSTRGDQGWQFVSFVGTAGFDQGQALMDITVARRSNDLANWRIEEFKLTLPSVE